MHASNENKKRSVAAFWRRLIIFLLLLTLVLSYTCYVLTPKYDYGICSMMNLYQQARNTVDVLVLGTSVAYSGVNTNVLWKEYGIASYDLCNAEQPYWISYYYLEEALKRQSPKLIVLDAKASIYHQDYSGRGRTIMSTFGILSPLTRFKAIAASVRAEDFLSFATGFAQVHSSYPKLDAQSFRLPPDNGGRGNTWKGYIEADRHERHERPNVVWTTTRRPIHDRQREYFEKILALANERDIPVLLVGFPTPDYQQEHMFYNSLWALAEAYGVKAINYNDPELRFGLRYTTDFADWQHLNVKGGVTLSRRLGEDIKAAFDVPDRRMDAAFVSYEQCAKRWYDKYPQYLPEQAP